MEKINNNDKRQYYRYMIDGNTVHFNWGEVGTDNPQSDSRTFAKGKNIGQANEKSPEQCCLEDTVSRARKKHESGYTVIQGMDIIEMHTHKNVRASDINIPKPMKAQTMKDHWKKLDGVPEVYVQPKLDGNRGLINIRTGKMYSSGRKEITHLPDIVARVVEACDDIKDDVEWVDGELFSTRLIFNDLQKALRRWKHLEKPGTKKLQAQIKFYMFDLIMDRPFSERQEYLAKIKANSKVKIVPTYTISPADIEKHHDLFLEYGYEGIMIRTMKTMVKKKWTDMPYESKRSMQIFKHKNFEDAEFEVIGFESQEHDPTKLGAAVLRFEGDVVFNARPGMTDDHKADIWANQDEYIGRMATVKFQERDPASNIPRFPVLTKFRLPEDLSEEKES
jgi:ATP-dependent DNA ligase